MRVIHSPEEMQEMALSLKRAGKSIAFVPTMGFLHEGHLSLIRRARSGGDILVVSIFVNPAQFGPSEDFEDYPRDPVRDLALCEKEGADIVFTPSVEEIYPSGYSTFVEETDLSRDLCGRKRPGHFKGVTTVVAKLFNIVLPDRAYFGRKDYQQSRVIARMVKDLSFPVKVVTCPIVREEDGLAMSSRNKYLGRKERKEALSIRRALDRARDLIEKGEESVPAVIGAIEEIIAKEPAARLDYIEIRDAENLEELDRVRNGAVIALAVFVGKTRLIDNLLI